MTRDDNLFDIKYVIFDAGEAQSLISKDVFVSSSLLLLRDIVNEMGIDNPHYYGKLHYAKNSITYADFKIDSDDMTFKYVYYDPYYELKCAFKRGETIEYSYNGLYWVDADNMCFSDKPEYYRIKPKKPALKWQDIKIGDILRGPLYDNTDDVYGIVNMIDTDSTTDKHIHIGDSWMTDEEVCKLHRVNAAGENI